MFNSLFYGPMNNMIRNIIIVKNLFNRSANKIPKLFIDASYTIIYNTKFNRKITPNNDIFIFFYKLPKFFSFSYYFIFGELFLYVCVIDCIS